MKKFLILVLVVVLSLFTFTTTAFAKTPCAEDYRKTQSIKLKVADNLKVTTTSDSIVKLKKGDTVKGYRFYRNLVYVKLSSGKYAYIHRKHLRTVCGRKIPKLPKTVTLKRDFMLEGEVLPCGTKLKVQYYAFSDKGFLMAYCYEGFISTKYLKK